MESLQKVCKQISTQVTVVQENLPRITSKAWNDKQKLQPKRENVKLNYILLNPMQHC